MSSCDWPAMFMVTCVVFYYLDDHLPFLFFTLPKVYDLALIVPLKSDIPHYDSTDH